MKCFGKLYQIGRNECITYETHYDFLYHIQWALLVALKEQERLDIMQYRHAEEELKRQRVDQAKEIMKKRNSND